VTEIDTGEAGASAQREYERRVGQRERRIEERYGTGLLGKFVKLVSDEPATTTAWRTGAEGERRLARRLNAAVGDLGVVLHDRRVPGTRGNIDHLVIVPTGVWVIDAKTWSGKVECREVGGWFRTDERLFVGGRDRSKAVEGMSWQVDASGARAARWRPITL
jgi:Nuclease-related domain